MEALIPIISAIAPMIAKMLLEWWTGKKLSEEEFQAFLDAHRKKRERTAQSTIEFEEEIEELFKTIK